MNSCQVVVWVRSIIEPDLYDNSVPFDNTTPILSDQSAMEIRVKIRVRPTVALFSHFFAENNENEHLIFRGLS